MQLVLQKISIKHKKSWLNQFKLLCVVTMLKNLMKS